MLAEAHAELDAAEEVNRTMAMHVASAFATAEVEGWLERRVARRGAPGPDQDDREDYDGALHCL